MNRQVGSHDRHSARHGFHQGMSESFCVGGSDVNIASTVYVMQKMVGNCAEFHNLFGDPEPLDKFSCGFGAVRAGILLRTEGTGQEQHHPALVQSILYKRNRPQQRLKIPVVVVVANEKQAQRTVRGIQLLLSAGGQCASVLAKCLKVKTVMDGENRSPSPALQFFGESATGGDGAVGPINRPLGEDAFDPRVRPDTVVSP